MQRGRSQNKVAVQPWQHDDMDRVNCDVRSTQVVRILELARALAAAETAVLTGDEVQAVDNLKRLQAGTSQMVAELEQALARDMDRVA